MLGDIPISSHESTTEAAGRQRGATSGAPSPGVGAMPWSGKASTKGTEAPARQPVAIALGSNLADPRAAVQRGWAAVTARLALCDARLSTIIHSPPAEGAAGTTFANAVGVGYTTRSPWQVLRALRLTERAFGRDRETEGRHGARPLDLDLLQQGAWILEGPSLVLPHPRSHGRDFVLGPWASLEPDRRCARCGATIGALAAAVARGRAVACGAAVAAHEPRPGGEGRCAP